MRSRPRKQSGFTLVEVIVVTCILAVLASVAIASMRDYTRRARVSEVVVASSTCKTAVSESYPVRDSPPAPGAWGCEASSGNTYYAGPVQTSADGVIRVTIANMDPLVNGHHIYLVPARSDGLTPMVTPNDLGSSVRSWICGSDWLPVRNALPANCHHDTTGYSSADFN
jgi:type IV pilus assembly protein PilA